MPPTAAEVIWDWEIGRAGGSTRLPDAVRDAYDAVDLQAAQELAVQATTLLEAAPPGAWVVGRESTTVLLVRLASLWPGALNGLHTRLLDQGVPEAMGWPEAVNPEVVFHRAGAVVRDRLLGELQQAPPEREFATRLLLALAWVDDDVVLSAFDGWIRLDPPPPWVPEPYRERAPSWLAFFPPSAGWTIAADGQGARYPACPRCGELMPFLGQVDTSEAAWGEGAIYAFYDAACALAATVYQQT